jgi:hypothetical protein
MNNTLRGSATNPRNGSSIFVEALTGTVPGSGDTGTYTPASGGPAVNLTNIPLSKLNSDPTLLDGFDTVITYEVCGIGSPANANSLTAINTFFNAGGKVMMFDSDVCSPRIFGTPNYGGITYPFATNNPGNEGALGGKYDSIVSSTLTTGLALGVQTSDTMGDANVFTTYNGNWIDPIAVLTCTADQAVRPALCTAGAWIAEPHPSQGKDL